MSGLASERQVNKASELLIKKLLKGGKDALPFDARQFVNRELDGRFRVRRDHLRALTATDARTLIQLLKRGW